MSNWKAAIIDQCATAAQRLLPWTCLLCGAATAGTRICDACDATLPSLTASRCWTCALPLTSGTVCGACLACPPHYDHASAPYAYAFPIDALIAAFKYGGTLSIAPLLASKVGDADVAIDALVPMPLASRRLRERGFNQAHELARLAAQRLGIPVLAHACRKVADTPPQAALPWNERERNVRGAFVCDADLTGMKVAVVDDVMTTGATLDELARNLKRAGAVHVSCWVVARTLK